MGIFNNVSQLPATGSPGDSHLIDGDLYVWSATSNDWENVGTIQGPQGNTGAQGPQGNTGPQGATGATGAQGPQGNTGPQGATGPMGPQGPQGEDGATGATGPQGNTGPQGPQGATGPQGPAGSANISGTTNRLIKFTGATTGGNSQITDNGTNIGIGFTSPLMKTHIVSNDPGHAVRIENSNIAGTSSIAFADHLGTERMYIGYANTGYSSGWNGNAYINTPGNLVFATQNGEKMRILQNGNAGIGISSPESKLQVVEVNPNNFLSGIIQGISNNPSGTTNDISGVYGENIVTDYWGIGVKGQGGYIGVLGQIFPSESQDYYGVYGSVLGEGDGIKYGVYGEADGNGNSIYAGYFAGKLAYTGSLIPASDERLKENIQTMDGALEKVLLLRPTTYEFRRDEYSLMNLAKGHQFGFIAQEVKEVFPNLVHDNVHVGYPDRKDKTTKVKTEYVGMDYVSLIPVLTAAIQEQQVQIEAQQAQIEQLQLQMEELIKK